MKKRRLKRYVKSHKSLFLSLAASTGVVLTGIFAGTGAIKANKIIKSEEKKAEIGNVELTKTDIFLLTWKCYIPAVASGVGSIVCIFGLNVLNKKQQEQLISAYALLNNTYHEYRKQVMKKLERIWDMLRLVNVLIYVESIVIIRMKKPFFTIRSLGTPW